MLNIPAGLVLVKNALDIITGVRKTLKEDKKLSNHEMLDYLSTLQDKLIDVKTSLADADDENRALKRKLQELEDELARRQFMKENDEFRDNMIWHKVTKEGPYCPTCFDHNDKLSRLQYQGVHGHYCVIHKTYYETPAELD